MIKKLKPGEIMKQLPSLLHGPLLFYLYSNRQHQKVAIPQTNLLHKANFCENAGKNTT